MFIKNYYGEKIEVTDLKAAIREAKLCSDSPFIMTTYRTTNQPIPESEQITVGRYYRHALNKLLNLKNKQS